VGGNMHVHVLHALSDNYMYLIIDGGTKAAAVVDPADAGVAAEAAHSAGAKLMCILTTHHHFDHAGGNNDLKKLVDGIEVCGGDDVQGMTRKVQDGDTFAIGCLKIQCVHTPAHTSGHMSYLVSDPSAAPGTPAALFTGDALFVGGCGRFFEGGPEQMVEGTTKLAALPPSTLVFCGHEYTLKNMQFAISVEPDNPDVQKKIMWTQEQRQNGKVTVPSDIGSELLYNPFMRYSQPAVKQHVGGGSDVEVMRKLRNAKDSFAGTSRPWIPGGGPLPGL